MKNTFYILFFIAISYKTTAQITYIPDSAFEQALISLNIDSDGVVNGQVLTSDIENITELQLYANIGDLTGIQDFTALEYLEVGEHLYELTSVDLSSNINLKYLYISQNSLTELDLSNNVLLEELYCGNPTDDVSPQNQITELDLSNNPNIRIVFAENMSSLNWINLKNNNNNEELKIDISITYYGMGDHPDYDPNDIYNTVCIEVDDYQSAQNNQFPYSDWNIIDNHVSVHFSDNAVKCSLGKSDFYLSKINIYPNPVSDILYFDTVDLIIEKVLIFDMLGRKTFETNNVNHFISVSELEQGNYILKIVSDKGIDSKKILIK